MKQSQALRPKSHKSNLTAENAENAERSINLGKSAVPVKAVKALTPLDLARDRQPTLSRLIGRPLVPQGDAVELTVGIQS